MSSARPTRSQARRAFTLVELLVVIVIILLLTAATLPTVIPAINQRKVSAAALILQAELARVRDAAIRANAPRGLRLVPERHPDEFNGTGTNVEQQVASQVQFAFFDPNEPSGYGKTPAYTRMVAIEPGPQYSEGLLQAGYPVSFTTTDSALDEFHKFGDIPTGNASFPTGINRIVVQEVKLTDVRIGNSVVSVPADPTNWFWNIRRGDRMRINSTGQTYTVAGPVLVPNPEDFINWGPPSPPWSTLDPSNTNQEFLFLVNNADDNADGYTDEAIDGVDNDLDGHIDPGYNSIDDNGNGVVDETAELALGPFPPAGTVAYNFGEYEHEAWLNAPPSVPTPYTIYRRPVPSPGAREIVLPTGVAIDMTTWNPALYTITGTSIQSFTSERSRLPVDPLTGYVDIMINPNGQVIQAGATSSTSQAAPAATPFYHFWIADVEDIYEPIPTAGVHYLLPMPGGAPYYPKPGLDTSGRVLKGERRLVTLNTRSGQITTTTPDNFNGRDGAVFRDYPYLEAQAGIKEQP